jgi:hypothetical protein
MPCLLCSDFCNAVAGDFFLSKPPKGDLTFQMSLRIITIVGMGAYLIVPKHFELIAPLRASCSVSAMLTRLVGGLQSFYG